VRKTPIARKVAMISLRQRQKRSVLSLTTYRPPILSFDASEGQYFQFFRTKAARQLSRYVGSNFWTSVLQESHSQASIRHIVVALGALYKTLEHANSPESSSSDLAPYHYRFALKQYAKAVRADKAVRSPGYWLQNKKNPLQGPKLMVMVLSICFHSFLGNFKEAALTFQSGFDLLNIQIRQHGNVAENELFQVFTGLTLQASFLDMAFHRSHLPRIIMNSNLIALSSIFNERLTLLLYSHMPGSFTDLTEARTVLYYLCGRIQLFSWYHSRPYITRKDIQDFDLLLFYWEASFSPFLKARRNRPVTLDDQASIITLRMTYLMTRICLVTNFLTSEDKFDIMPRMDEIVTLAKELVYIEKQGPSSGKFHSAQGKNDDSHTRASFSIEFGIVAPLFVVATQCRDRMLRRQAIQLLMSQPRREGMWDSKLCGTVAQWIMEVEEEGMRDFSMEDPLATNQILGDERRVMIKYVNFDLDLRTALVWCGTYDDVSLSNHSKARHAFLHW
jgi:hypothetical protein